MKSYHSSFSPVRRALIAATVVLATGSVAALAQTADRGSSASTPSTGSNYDTSNSNANSNSSGMSSSNASTSGTDMSSNTSATSNDSSSKISWSDKRFLNKVAEGNQQEIQIAQLAVDHASNPDVKTFAQQLVQDHQKLGSDLQSLASSHNVELKAENKDKESHEYKKLAQASGSDFDQQFIKQMVSEHKKDIKEFKDRADDAKDPDVKAFAQNALPTLQHHLDMAQNLESSIVPTGRTGGLSGQGPSASSTSTSSTDVSGNSTISPNTSSAMPAASASATTSSTGAASSTTSTSTPSQ